MGVIEEDLWEVFSVQIFIIIFRFTRACECRRYICGASHGTYLGCYISSR